jgi:outer membrane scaffolding protein for murein synthesis (MipA/OmpV family)
MPVRTFTLVALAIATPAAAQTDAPEAEREPMRTRIYAGPQLSPATPGASDLSFGPFFDISRARGDDPFPFEAPDESFGFTIARTGGVEFGPALGFESKRKPSDIGLALHEVDFSFEIGGFVQTYLADQLRVRAEARKAVSGHRGWVGEVSLDYVWRDRDDWLFSIGPRVTLADAGYHRAWYGITPADSAASGLPTYSPGGGIESVGVTAGYLRQLSRRWGIAAYARYDRLVGDAAASPYVRTAGSRNQPSLGLALSYTFGGKQD